MNMLMLFKPGDEIAGYCNGYFGRNDYDAKVCIMVMPKYAVFQNEEGEGRVLNYEESLGSSNIDIQSWKDEALEEDLS